LRQSQRHTFYQHHENGKCAVQAAIEGTLEVIPPIVSAILTTILAFGILLFLDGRIGEFFSEVSVIVILTLVVSLVEALIILPSHLAHSKALKPQQEPKTLIGKGFAKMRVINQTGDRAMVWMRDQLYTPFLKFALKTAR
jgi:multidrug efflux pump subunit AcrB